MISFSRLRLSQKAQYEDILFACAPRSCEYSFANLYLWGRQEATFFPDCAAFFSHFYGKTVYPYPIGTGDRRAVLEAILNDAEDRGIPCRITGLTQAETQELEGWFPGKFLFRPDRDSFDYVYSIDDLADLKGRKFQKKRNHVNKFRASHPDCRSVPLERENLPQAQQMVAQWFRQRLAEDPHGDYLLEQIALNRAFRHFEALGLEGLMLVEDGQVLAVTMASRLSENTMDVHFEKAREDVDGAYAAVNCEFARHLRMKHPELEFLNREDDMGLPGLRQAKLSYQPHHMAEKYCAYLAEGLHEEDDVEDTLGASFGDDGWIDGFFRTAFREENTLAIIQEGHIAAGLAWMETSCQGRRLAYLYAVATAPEFRHRGLCRELMEKAHRLLAQRGYDGSVLVPADEGLRQMYAAMGYRNFGGVRNLTVTAGTPVPLREVTSGEYAALRRKYLPEGGIVQENGAIEYLAQSAKLCAGSDFLLAATEDAPMELLGDASQAPGILGALGKERGTFRLPGTEPFAMFRPTREDAWAPTYFGLAFE